MRNDVEQALMAQRAGTALRLVGMLSSREGDCREVTGGICPAVVQRMQASWTASAGGRVRVANLELAMLSAVARAGASDVSVRLGLGAMTMLRMAMPADVDTADRITGLQQLSSASPAACCSCEVIGTGSGAGHWKTH